MSLTKPIAQKIGAFDATTTTQRFSFTSSGGDQVVANKLTIVLSDTEEVVYTSKVESYNYYQDVDPTTSGLINGNYYKFYFNTYNVNGDESASSDSISFYCLTTPIITLSNLPATNVVESNSYAFTATYNQAENDLLDYLKFYLYDNYNNVLAESDNYYSTTSMLPVSFTHTFSGFDNNTIYKFNVKATSVKGIIGTSETYTFTTKYSYSEVFSLLDLENDCKDGCVKLTSNVFIADGKVSSDEVNNHFIKELEAEDPSQYIMWDESYSYESTDGISEWTQPYALDVHYGSDWVKWDKGFSIPSNFTIKLYMLFGKLGTFAIMGDKKNGITLDIVREIPYNGSTVKDVVELNGYKNGNKIVTQRSNYVDIFKQGSSYLVWVRKNGNDYTLQLNVLTEGTDDVCEWGNSNVWNERVTTLAWDGEEYTQGVEFTPLTGDISSIFPLTEFKLTNGIFDHMDISKNVTSEYSTDKPSWDYDTRLQCNFNDNIRGGNVNMLLSTIKFIKLKRKESGTFNTWITLGKYEIKTVEDLNVSYNDYYVPSGYAVDYALVPITEGGIEGDYVVNNITTQFNTTTIADSNKVFALNCGITYSGDTLNTVVSTYQPLSGTYPILQKNSELNYYSGSITANLFGYEFDNSRTIDRNSVVEQTNDLCQYLNNLDAKIIKDWNGKIFLVRFVGNPTVTYNSSYGNGIATVTASWVEQGEFDNQEDLYYNGLIDILE